MTPVRPGHGPGQVGGQIRVNRRRDVACGVLVTAPRQCLQVGTAVDDRPGFRAVRRQRGGRDLRRVHAIRRPFSLQVAGTPSILFGTPMTSTVLIFALVALTIIALFAVRRVMRHSEGATHDLGVVSTRWISELRRDEPWTRS